MAIHAAKRFLFTVEDGPHHKLARMRYEHYVHRKDAPLTDSLMD